MTTTRHPQAAKAAKREADAEHGAHSDPQHSTPSKRAKEPKDHHQVASIAGLGLVDTARWFALPLELRRRYWHETDYGRQRPSDAMLAEIEAAADGALVIEGRGGPSS